jgi:hypothetical protein
MKSTNGSVMHQFHPRRDHLHASTSLIAQEEVQLVEDLNCARAKLGTAANLHCVRSGRQGAPTLLSRNQIAHLCKKKHVEKKGEDGPTDDTCTFLKESGNYCVSLLARGPTPKPSTTTDPTRTSTGLNATTDSTGESAGKSILFNETGSVSAPVKRMHQLLGTKIKKCCRLLMIIAGC